MTPGSTSVFGHLTQFRSRLRTHGLLGRANVEEPPLRSELFSAEQMERHGSTLAARHHLTSRRSRDALLPRLAANEATLLEVRKQLTRPRAADQRVSPAGDWLLDNFHLIEQEIATAKRHLPRGYSRQLPRLARPASPGLPRVYDIALEAIAHGDGRVDAESLARFVTAYQSVATLNLGELWAIPIMLRLALIENLRRVAVRLAAGRAERDLAGAWADRMMETAERDAKSLILVIADMARSDPPMGSAFVAELARRLQGQSAGLALALTWIEQRLAETHLTIERLVQLENQQQASDQVSISNSIGSLRLLGAIDWRVFVEAVSVAEQVLRDDPQRVYADMAFVTRDAYRHAIERIAARSHLAEADVARRAIELARARAERDGVTDRAAHVGYYLIDDGVVELEAAVAVRGSARARLERGARRFPLALYLGAVALVTCAITAVVLANIDLAGAGALLRGAALALLLIGASQLAVTLVNWLVTALVPPRTLARMDFSTAIPGAARTLVVVPTMLTGARNVEALVDALEVRFLANRDEHLHFALLTDFPDAAVQTLPADEELLALAQAGIARLNRKHGASPDESSSSARDDRGGSAFYLFHRPRRWNPEAGIWMGYERKRGKLDALNAFLRGGLADDFALIVGSTAVLTQVRYVITLDTDTQLPRDAARQMVGAMAHPLNTARFDKRRSHTGRDVVTVGHGILQPRVSVSLPGTNRSRYARLCAGQPGLDQYTRAVSDVYQDAFGEGSFIGKGIYDVDAVERALHGRLPVNRILSHDLLEGCYARSGLLSDVELYEELPARYSADIARRRRWIRGDWQLAGWLRRRVRGPDGGREANPLSLLSQWKLFDNLRRSVVPGALVLLLLAGWTVLPAPGAWIVFVLAVLLAPSVIAVLSDLVRRPVDVPLRQHLAGVRQGAGVALSQSLLATAFLPYEAFVSADAIVRTLGRLLFTRRRLLEWSTSSEVERALEQRDRTDLRASYKAMASAPLLAATTWIALAALRPTALVVAAPVLLLWAVAPAIAWWISAPLARRESRVTGEQAHFLRALARRTWAYFETYVGAEDHWLPPDNVQEHPEVRVAHRTSPTNMGLALLANLTAYDFGYLSCGRLLARTRDALESMASLERHAGHFYNWYDTRTRAPLAPLYISTVDSGNLAGHLMTLRPGLAALADEPIVHRRWLAGAEDALRIVRAGVGAAPPAMLARLEESLASETTPPGSLVEAWTTIGRIHAEAEELAVQCAAASASAATWARALVDQCADMRDDVQHLAPWLAPTPCPVHAALPGATGIPTLRELASVPGLASAVTAGGETAELRDLVLLGCARAAARLASIDALVLQAGGMATMDYDFLFDAVRRQLVIGYNVAERRCDASYYDLLASEARLSTFVAIAQGKLPQESWFALGRPLTAPGGEPVMLAWSGSMFEYLMPLLVMPTYENTLLDQTYGAAVARQIDYGRQRGVPWGISESGYNAVDTQLNYQYRAFGVPGLGLKRGLADDLVVTPYASALALMVDPAAACQNLQRLSADGVAGRFGLFEAVDYTPSRQRRGESRAIVRSYMAHHQAMTLLACAYALLGRPMQKRFEADPLFQATLLLLQERIPRSAPLHPAIADVAQHQASEAGPQLPVRVIASADTPVPEVQLLSNGRYHVMISNAGGGSSRWKDLAVTRWREDGTADHWGTFCYLRDEASGTFWSSAYQPTLQRADHYEAIFSEGRAEFRRSDVDFETHTEIVVSPEDDVEVRRLHITNRSRLARTIEVTSYAEVVLAPAAADALHPAFSNLFVQTEIVPERKAIVCTRRARSMEEGAPWMFHLMTVHDATAHELSFETDRARFIGRAGSLVAPAAMTDARILSNTSGPVLDPIAAIRRRITIEAGGTATLDMVTGAGESRDAVLHLVDRYQDRGLADRAFELTWTHSQVVLRQLNITEADSQLYARLASSVIYANPSLRAAASVLVRNRRSQSGLWGYAISGDLPIVLLQIASGDNIELVRQLVQAHAYWRSKGLAVDLVIWNEDHHGYRQILQEQIIGLVAAGVEAHAADRPGRIYVRHAEQISPEDRVLFESVARAIISDGQGTLAAQINRRMPADPRVPRLVPTEERQAATAAGVMAPRDDLVLFNGIGGFAEDGREYVIAPRPGETTPAPWVNVIANASFGTVVSAQGPGYTWSENAHLFRLTPWHNDPVTEAGGEALYLRDEATGHFWSPTPFPCGGAAPFVTRHGFGYTVFEHVEDGIRSELEVFVALDDAVKFYALTVHNQSGRARRLSATGYVEWVLSDARASSAMHVTTTVDPTTGALYARNPYNGEFSRTLGVFDVDDAARTVSGDRTEFIGRNGTLRDPAAMHRTRLSGKVGAALDPCGALQVTFDLAADAQRQIVFRLGAARDQDAATALVQRFRGVAAAHEALEAVKAYWGRTLGAVQIRTPDRALDVLTNGWLVYQTLACRLWARSGYYQSGGAFGFRDQLQDAMALVHAQPQLLRAQIVLCASRQFVEGDVQHWWHPPSGRGVRTHCSDDFLWLALATCRYVEATGDHSVLDEPAWFLEGRPLAAESDSYYDLPARADETASVYAHCVKAVLHALRFGVHGLPLIGSGDWNDGMNLVGRHGKGESVWLGFFLCHVLDRFAGLAQLRGDAAFAGRCATEALQLRERIEQNAWDGGWYRRAYFDDGSPLGSQRNDECQIDSIAQSWAVLSGAGEASRVRTAMDAVDARLVRRDAGLIQLLDPAFDHSALEPGYIRGYVPGVRENGGQYTHAAIWTAMAFAALGDHDRAFELTAMINPVNHARTPGEIATYKVEPYVVAADVYARAPHTGRGGWTWYTGSAGWMYRLVVESLLGIARHGERLHVAPCLPAAWPGFEVRYRFGDTYYDIIVRRADAGEMLEARSVTLDGVGQEELFIALVDDRREHRVEVRVPAVAQRPPLSASIAV